MLKFLKMNFSTKGVLAQAINSLNANTKGLIGMNKIREYQPDLTEEQKNGKKRFLVFRSNPEDPNNEPYLMSYFVDMKNVKPMYLDALLKIKDEMDSTLSFRRSCREGVCGSCAMNLDGLHKLACIQSYDSDPNKVSLITPLGHMYVIKDLVVDMSNFYAQYRSIQPFLQRSTPKEPGQKEYFQSVEDRQLLDGLYECVLCASCSTSCPSYWWSPEEYLGPAVLM